MRTHLLHVARDLGLSSGAGWWSWDKLLDCSVVRYWQLRPNIRPDCGSDPGYRVHLSNGETPCQPCRDAHAMVRAIARRRRQRGERPFGGRPPLKPCGTHAAHNRHKLRGEPVDDLCAAAEIAYQARRGLLTGYALTTGVSGLNARKDTG